MSVVSEEITRLIPNYDELPNLVDTHVAAELYGVRVQTLAADRCGKRRFAYVKVGGSVKYPKATIAEYLLENLRGGVPA